MSLDVPGNERFRVGDEVVLLDAIYGYEPGAPGVVMRARTGDSRPVRTTGHTLSVPRELLAASPDAAADGG